MVRNARLTMYLVCGDSDFSSQRFDVARTHSGCDLLASLSQLPTEFFTYFESSASNDSKIGNPNSGLSYLNHTP